MRRSVVLGCVAVLVAVVAGCSQSVSPPPTGSPTQAPTASVEAGPEFLVELVGIDISGGTVRYHPATRFEGSAAVKAAREDGITDLGAPYYVRVATETEVLPLDPGASVLLLVSSEDTGMSPIPASVSEFVAEYADLHPSDPWVGGTLFWLRTAGGRIVSVRGMPTS